jgi:hypothetical protein
VRGGRNTAFTIQLTVSGWAGLAARSGARTRCKAPCHRTPRPGAEGDKRGGVAIVGALGNRGLDQREIAISSPRAEMPSSTPGTAYFLPPSPQRVCLTTGVKPGTHTSSAASFAQTVLPAF